MFANGQRCSMILEKTPNFKQIMHIMAAYSNRRKKVLYCPALQTRTSHSRTVLVILRLEQHHLISFNHPQSSTLKCVTPKPPPFQVPSPRHPLLRSPKNPRNPRPNITHLAAADPPPSASASALRIRHHYQPNPTQPNLVLMFGRPPPIPLQTPRIRHTRTRLNIQSTKNLLHSSLHLLPVRRVRDLRTLVHDPWDMSSG
jgi:hypothetical protein